MIDPRDIEKALAGVRDQGAFLRLLSATLRWPIEGKGVEDVSYTWTEKDLRAAGLDKKVVDSRIFQIANLDRNQPWGVFVIEFKNPDAFLAERGLTGVLRQVLRGLVPSKRKDPNQPAWKREHLLFICTHKYLHFRVAYFKAPHEGTKTAPLAAFGWGPDIPARTACEFNLPALEWPDNPSDAAVWISAWADAFNVERVTKRFYKDYAEQFEKLRVAVKPLKGEDQKMFTQALMNRLMFLRFIERKGWLTPPTSEEGGGSKDYLRLLFQAGGYRGKSFYSGRLKKLFFEALAIEGKERSDAVGTVVFLNGGLFEESDLDKQVDDLPDSAFIPLLGPEGLLYRYNFTVQESTPLDIEVAVDPEMLGKVFEELVTGRHESGSYYTPRPVVSFMCREALKGYLADATEIDPEKIGAFVEKHDVRGITIDGAKRIAQALDDLRAVDPACGSGAYLLGLLHEIVDLYRLLYSDKLKADARELHRIKLDIIQKCLYGTDIDPFATSIAMLRLWLSLTVDSDEPEALPNLDFKIETGDALTGPNPQEMPDLLRSNLDERARQLAIIKGKYMRAHGREKQTLRELIQHEQREIAFKLRSLSPGAIDWRVQFCEVFFSRRAGFDIVLANPPYVRQELIKDVKPLLKAVYGDLFSGTADLYVFFYLRGLQLLASGGMLVFISSNKWFRARYGEKLRKVFATSTRVRIILDFRDLPVFETAIAYPMVFVASKGAPHAGDAPVLVEPETLDPPYPDINEVVRKHGLRLPPTALAKSGDWYLGAPGAADTLGRIRAKGVPLGAFVHGKIFYGIKTGLNDAFVIDHTTRDRLIQEHAGSTEVLKPFARGRDIKRWRVESNDLWLVFTRRGIDIKQYPAIERHLRQFKPALMPGAPGGRKAGSYEWYEIQDNIAYWEEFTRPKIIVPAIQNDVHYAVDSAGFYSNDKTSIIIADDLEFVLGILNSSVSWWLTRQLFASRQSGFFEFKPMYLSQIPIPGAEPAERAVVEAIVRCLVALHHQTESTAPEQAGRHALMSAYFERLLNGLVFELYFRGDLGDVRLFDAIKSDGLPPASTLAGGRSSLDGIQAYFEALYRNDHPGRAALDRLQSLDVVRTIEAQP
jgi:hypothetical protein